MRESEQDALIALAHELRSPLSGVKGMSATLLTQWDRLPDADRRTLVETIAADAERLSRLIGDILDAGKVARGRLPVDPQELDLAAVARAHLEGRIAAGVEPRRLRLQVEDPLTAGWVDPDRFIQVLTNLVDNALVHGAGRVSVELAASPADGGVELVVGDEGPGIPPEHRTSVFEQYWQSGSSPGSGLGLYLVRGIVEAHGGWVAVDDSTPGARLRCHFPGPAG